MRRALRRGREAFRLRLNRRAAGDEAAALDVLPQFHLHLEPVGFDRQAFLDLQLIVRVIDQLEPLQDHAQNQRRLLHRELTSDTGALAVAEGLVGVDRPRRDGLAGEVVRIELFRVLAPDRLVAVEHQGKDRDEVLRAQAMA